MRFRKLHPLVERDDLDVFTYQTEKQLWLERLAQPEIEVKRREARDFRVLPRKLRRRLMEDEYVPPLDLCPAAHREMHETLVAWLEVTR